MVNNQWLRATNADFVIAISKLNLVIYNQATYISTQAIWQEVLQDEVLAQISFLTMWEVFKSRFLIVLVLATRIRNLRSLNVFIRAGINTR